MSPEQILAEAEIRSLVIQERFYRDAGEWQKLRGCYHPDDSLTMIDISWYQGDADGFVRRSAEMAAAGSQSMHTIQPAVIDLNGAKGFAQSVGTIASRFERDGKQYDMVSKCRLLSRLMQVQNANRTHKDWYMLSMEVIYLQDNIFPVVPEPFSSDPDFVRALSKKRKSYPVLSVLLENKGLAVNDKLPGSDDEESVDRVLQTNRKWLLS